jgi:large subunit ribosomal protein L23
MGIFSKITKKQNIVLPKEDKEPKDAKKAPAAAAEKTVKPAVRGPLAKAGGGRSHRVLITPLLTEKADRQQALSKYAFLVATDANKNEIACAVRDLYGVKPVSVNVISVKGKNVRFGRSSGQQKDVKKAIITLKKGESISVLEGV